MMQRTVASVYDPKDARQQRWQAWAKDQCGLNALSMFAQVYIGFSLYLYDHVSTPGYLSLWLTVPYALLLWGLGRFLAGRVRPETDVITSAAGKHGAKFFYGLFAVSFLLDAQGIFFALCALMRDVLPGHSSVLLALAAAGTVALALNGGQEYALPRLGHFLKFVVAALLLYCGVMAVPHGSVSYFFPLLGRGLPSIGRGTLWLCGSVSAAAWPFLMPQHEKALAALWEKKRVSLRPLGLALGGGTLAYFVSVWLTPFYALSRPEDVGWRLLLAVHMTPSIPAWSMAVMGLLMLFLLALAFSAEQAAGLLARCLNHQKHPILLRVGLLLLLVPAGVFSADRVQEILAAAVPWRGVLVLALLLILSLSGLIRGRKP